MTSGDDIGGDDAFVGGGAAAPAIVVGDGDAGGLEASRLPESGFLRDEFLKAGMIKGKGFGHVE